jgi:uncharacterized membrane protein
MMPVRDLTADGGPALARVAAIAIALAYLAYLAADFYVGALIHFALDYSEENFGRFWPNRFWLLSHIAGGSLALLVGPFQLWSGLRHRALSVHRWTGRLYVAGVLLGGTSAFYLVRHASPPGFAVALFALAVAWWTTVAAGVAAVKRHRLDVHKRWMIRSYVVTFSFVTFRWWLDAPVWSALGASRLAVVLWASWVVPLAVVEVAFRARRQGRHARHPEKAADLG